MPISILFERFRRRFQNVHEALGTISHKNGVQNIINTPHHSPNSAVGEPQNGGPNVEDLGDWILDASEIEFCKVNPWAINLGLDLPVDMPPSQHILSLQHCRMSAARSLSLARADSAWFLRCLRGDGGGVFAHFGAGHLLRLQTRQPKRHSVIPPLPTPRPSSTGSMRWL